MKDLIKVYVLYHGFQNSERFVTIHVPVTSYSTLVAPQLVD